MAEEASNWMSHIFSLNTVFLIYRDFCSSTSSVPKISTSIFSAPVELETSSWEDTGITGSTEKGVITQRSREKST